MILDTNILLVIAAIQAVIIGFVCAEFARHTGPKGVKNASIVALVISFVLGVVLTPSSLMVFGSLLFALPTGLFSWWYGQKIVAPSVRRQIEMAPQVVLYLTRNYDRLASKDGITSVSLYKMLDEPDALPADEHELVTHIVRHMSDIGHCYDVVVVTGGSPMHGGASGVPVYAINRNDLRSYLQRVNDKYEAWLK
ncbi:hypothetical protein KF728_16935 [Candidatus Obscuribacterales bacterium]|nr:hypothetical protein [Candidatus Obscuribacterales bacterium]